MLLFPPVQASVGQVPFQPRNSFHKKILSKIWVRFCKKNIGLSEIYDYNNNKRQKNRSQK